MSNSIRFEGLDELRATLRRLPKTLVTEATPIVTEHVDGAEREINANYDAHIFSGNLRAGMRREDWRAGAWGVGYVLRNVSKHAWIFEHGTAARHYISHKGVKHETGTMPPFRAFLPPVMRWRRRMYAALAEFLTRMGFEVTGRAA